MTAKDILESYEELEDLRQIDEGIFFFVLYDKQFLLCLPSEKNPASEAKVWLYNDELFDYPHIMLQECRIETGETIPKGTYRVVCLYEHESVVNSIFSYEEKITDCIDRLIELLSMNQVQKELEFRKEFMFYWNEQSVEKLQYNIFLQHDNVFSELNVFWSEKTIRIIEQGLELSDLNKMEKGKRLWNRHYENDAFYIPINDARDILPPHRGYKWTAKDLRNIVYGRQINHIDDASFQKIKTYIPKTQNLILVFGMKTEASNVAFAINVKCRNGVGHTLLEKLLNDIIDVEPIHTERKDYSYLCEQIGNDIGLIEKRVLLVGAGSLGSYVAFELVKNGATKLEIYDSDNLEEENILRWAYGGLGKGGKKASTLQILLGHLHPEINVVSHNKKLDADTLIKNLSDNDLIIFTIGKSDEQLLFNRALKAVECSIPVLFVWLEDGGTYSHILYVNYQQKGCFECLYTDAEGNHVNNRARKNIEDEFPKSIIRNGCGGTRAAYGTATILRTTAALLGVLNDIEKRVICQSTLYDISPSSILISDTPLQTEECNCCGSKK